MRQNSSDKSLLSLFLAFFKVGLFTFGGGYAMIALLENEFVTGKKWMDKDEFLDMVAIAESTPGPIAINSATYIGYKLAGVAGSVLSTVAVCIPSVVIIFVISLYFDRFLSLTVVSWAFKGIQVCVIYLIGSAGIRMLFKMEKHAVNYLIFGIVLCLFTAFSLMAVKFSSIFFILICGLAGWILYEIKRLRG